MTHSPPPLLARLGEKRPRAVVHGCCLCLPVRRTLVHEEVARTAPGDEPIYYTDDYPRAGCFVVIDVGEDGSHMLATYAPNGRVMEVYAHTSSDAALLELLRRWLASEDPRGYNRTPPSSMTE